VRHKCRLRHDLTARPVDRALPRMLPGAMSEPSAVAAKRRFRPNLFHVTLPICAVVAAVGIASPDALADFAAAVTTTAFRALDWFFMALVSAFLILCLWLAFGRYGSVRLGRDTDRPDFSTASWLSMLFAAGMGVGLLFWGVAEPVTHYTGALGSEAGTPLAARRATVVTAFHWGLHAWSVYAVAALVLAYGPRSVVVAGSARWRRPPMLSPCSPSPSAWRDRSAWAYSSSIRACTSFGECP